MENLERENLKEDAEQILKDVAARIRGLRELSGKSETEMAKVGGVSLEEYQELESGSKDFNFTFIYKLAQCFGVDVTDILKGSSPTLSTYSVVRQGKGLPIARRTGFVYHNMAPYFKNKMAVPFWVMIPYSEEAEKQPIHLNYHKGQEVSILLKGSVRFQVGESIEELHEGDVLYFDSSTPHGMVAIGGKPCEFFTVIINPEGDAKLSEETMPISALKPEGKEMLLPEKQAGFLYEEFIETEVDLNGVLKNIKFKKEEGFNFAFDVVDAMALKDPGKLAMLHVDVNKAERRFTFGDISRLSSKAANYFVSIGIKKGDRVMLVLKRHYQFWIAIVALHKIGAIVIPATNQLVKKDFSYRFQAAGVSTIIATSDGEVAEQVELAEKDCPALIRKLIVNNKREGWRFFDGEYEAFPEVFDRPAGDLAACGSDIMLMFFTSGTTGYPKIAAHNFKYALGHFITAKYWHNVNPNGIHFTISDTGWGKALWGKLYGQWLCEAAIFTYDFDRFDANDILPMFKKYGITTFCAPPTMYRFFIKEDLSKFDLSSIEYATVAGEALNAEVYNKFLEATGVRLMEGFGQTETTLTIANLVGMTPIPGSMGKPSPLYDVSIVHSNGTPASVGETGEIIVRTKEGIPCGLYCGYYQNDEKTMEVWHDGAYHTGDTAYRDEHGYYWYVGRTDDLIKSSGYRIGPFEIESVIMELPYVLECAVTAAPDEVRGQVVKATVVLTKDTKPSDELRKEIQMYVKEHTAPYKYPRIVDFIDELPKTISGKIRRVELR